MSNKKKALNGIIWTSLEFILGKGIGFISTIFIARILSPKDYGIIGMTTIFVSLTSTLIDTGMTQSLIRKKKVSDIEYSSVFFLNVFLSFVFAGILCLISPQIAIFYNVPIINQIIKIYAITIIINTIRGIQIVKLAKILNFKKITYINLIGTFFGFLTCFILAYNNWGVWSLVYMTIVNSIVTTFLYWLLGEKITLYKFSFITIINHFKFGYKLTIASILNVFYVNLNNILIGKFFSIDRLGIYERSYYFNDFPISNLTGIITKIMYPLLSQNYEDNDKLKKIFRKIITSVFFVFTPFICIISGISKPLINLILGDKWSDIILYYKILSFGFILYPLRLLHLNTLNAIGKSNISLKLEIFEKLIGFILIGTIFWVFNFAIIGLLFGITINSYITFLFYSYFTKKTLNYTYSEQFNDISLAFILAIISGLIGYLSSILLSNYLLILNILISFIISISFYLISNFIFKNKGINYILEIFANIGKTNKF